MDSSSQHGQTIHILQSFHVQHQKSTTTAPVAPTGDPNRIDTLEHCRYFTTVGQALSPDGKGSLELQVLWDTGASHNFISKKWLTRYEQQFGICPVVTQNVRYRIADSAEERRTYAVRLTINMINGVRTSVCCSVLPEAPTYDVLLGKLWMQQHRVVLDTYRNFATGWFKGRPVGIHGEPGSKQQHPACNILHNIEEIRAQLKECRQEGLRPLFVQAQLISDTTKKTPDDRTGDSDPIPGTVHDYPGCSIDDRDSALQQIEKLKEEYSFLFKEWESDDLPPVRPDFDHRIELQPGSTVPHRNYYPIPAKMQEEARQLLSKFLNAGFLRSSKSPFAAPMMLIPKKTPGQWRIVFDFRALNTITVKDRHSIPRSQELFDTLYGSRIYSTFDLQDGYYHMRIREEDIAKTAVTTPFGHYEWVVMPMGLCNAPATFQ
eukprot:scaffold685_cov354-Pavlova_lutheri.AAC.4